MNDYKIHIAFKLFIITFILFNASCDSGDIYPNKIVSEEDDTGNATSFSHIQTEIFTSQCIMCHGGSSAAPAGSLRLTEGDSYNNLYDVPAASSTTTKKRIAPGDISQSFLIDVLENKVAPEFHYNHSTLSTLKSDNILLIKRWILDGAEEN